MKLEKVQAFFAMLADETRLKILISLSKGPLTVSKVHEHVPEISVSAISHQLKLMRNLDMLTVEKQGRKRLYSLSNKYCWCILQDALDHKAHTCNRCASIQKRGIKV